ncbi:ATP-binding cassette domain-containing protein [Lachnospiraceae bacterium 38-10]
MPESSTPYIELRHACLDLDGVRLLHNINLTIYPGTCHIVYGANGAGKTNLLRLLSGLYPPAEGRVILFGQELFSHTRTSANSRIAYCGQDFALFEELTVLDNFYIGYQSASEHLYSRRKYRLRLQNFFEKYDFSFPLDIPVSELDLSEKCLLQLARALFAEPSVLLVDEFDSFLNYKQASHIFHILQTLTDQGSAVVLATHSPELKELQADHVISLDNGYAHTTLITSDQQRKKLSEQTKRQGYTNMPRLPHQPGNILINASHITVSSLSDITFTLKKGEILGVCSSRGSSCDIFLEMTAGLREIQEGSLCYYPDKKHIKIGYLPEESSVFPDLSLSQNVTISNLTAVKGPLGLLDHPQEKIIYNDYVKRLGIRAETLDPLKLSKGNRQKLLLARCLHKRCNVYLLNNPTNNVDSAGKLELYNILMELSHKNVGIVIASADLNELHGLCDTIFLLSESTIIGRYDPREVSVEYIYDQMRTAKSADFPLSGHALDQ